jgi:hypothetical protein
MVDVVRAVWKRETGSDLDTIPQDLGKFELGSDEYSIGLALQQIAPYLRTGDPLKETGAKLGNGRKVFNRNDAVVWLIEQLDQRA